MNKLFTKVAALTLGVAMAAGVGVALGASHVSEVKATVAEAYKLDGMVQATGTSYNGDNEITQGGVTWIVNGNVNQTPWRIGGKNTNGLAEAGAIRKIWSQDAVTSESVSSVVITTTLPASNSLSATSVELKVGTAKGASDTSTLSQSFGNSIVFECPSNADWSSQYFEFDFVMPQNNTGTQKYFQVSSIVFYYESTTPRGTLEITNVPHIVEVGDKFTPSYIWTPEQGSSSTIVTESVAYTASDSEVLTKEGSTFTAAKAGFATVTLTATDSVSEEYVSVSHKVYVTNPYTFSVGDSVALCAPDVKQELSSISDGNTPYGVGAEYSENPAGAFELEVQEGSLGGSFAFHNEAGFLSWSAGNSLKVEDGKTENSAWYVVVYDSYMVIKNCADDTREIWWNAGTPRFACYTNKTPETSGYNTVDLYILGGQPVEDKYQVSFYEGTAGSSSEYAEGAKVTIPQPTEALIPEGKEFDYWEHKETGDHYAPGDEFTVGTSSARFDAVYKDVEPVVTEWTQAQKDAFADALDELVPPFIDAEFVSKINILVASNFADALVSGDKVNAVLTAFASWGEPYEQDGYYYFEQKTTHGTVTVGVGLSGDDTYFYIMFAEDAPVDEWSSDLKLAFAEQLEGVVPPFLGEEFAGIAWDDNVFKFIISVEGDKTGTIESVFAQTEWTADENEYYTPTSHGFAVCDYFYDEQKSETKVEIYFYQTKWYEEKEALFAQHLDGFVPNYHWALDYLSWYENIGQFAFGTYGDVTSYFVEAFLNAGMNQIVDPQTDEPVDGQYYIYTTHGTIYGITYVDSNVTYAYLYYVADPIPTSLSIDFSGAKTEYYVGDTLDTAGLVVVVLDENGDPMFNGENVAQYCEFDADLSAAGQVTVSVSIQVTQTITLEGSYQIEVSEAPVPVYTAEDFAHDFLELVSPICSNYDGKKNNKEALRGVWTTMAQRYSTLSNEEKAKVIQAAGKAGGSELERAMAFYDYACKKYGLTKFVSDRTPHALVLETSESNSIVPIIAIIAASIAAVTAIGVIIAYRRRKALISK